MIRSIRLELAIAKSSQVLYASSVIYKDNDLGDHLVNDDPLQPHSHEPNPHPPGSDPSFHLSVPSGKNWLLTPADLAALPQTAVDDCYIVSTGHGPSGPFTFSGVTLVDLIGAYWGDPWYDAEVVSGDGFGNRVLADEVSGSGVPPILLAINIDGRSLTRDEGLVRLIVPSERDDALRQVKWISSVTVRSKQ